MQFDPPLISANFCRRYKRFFADMVLADGREVTAHCANTGSMAGLLVPDSPAMLSRSDNPRRRLAYSWEMAWAGTAWVGVQPLRANLLAWEAMREARIGPLSGYATIRREVAFGERTRLDFLLEKPDGSRCYVEVKSVTLRQGETACFPDAVSARGLRHLETLTQAVAAGHRGVALYVVQRPDCNKFRAAAEIDPDYAAALHGAVRQGVETLAWSCTVDPTGIRLDGPLPVVA